MSVTVDHLAALFGESEGFVFIAHAGDRYVTDTGKVRHRDFTEKAYSYPRDLEQLAADVAQLVADRHDVWFTPTLSGNPIREGAKRKKLPVSVLSADLDGVTRPDRVQVLVDGGAWTIASGSTDSLHVYVPLAAPVPADEAEDMQHRLASYLDGDPAPTWHGAYLRPLGTLNFKAPTLGTGPAGVVEVVEPPSGGRWPVQMLDDLLPAVDREKVTYVVPDAEPLDALPVDVNQTVKDILDDPVTVGMDRSERVYSAVARLHDLGLTDGQVLTAMHQHPPAVARQQDGTNLTRDVARCLAKLVTLTTNPSRPVVEPCTINELHAVFRRWFGPSYDLDTIDATLAAAAVERLDGDPVWLLVISGSGFTKTETVQSLVGAGALVTSTITSVGALLSATPKKEKAANATGGLLRKLEPSGVLVIKDVTSILSQNSNTRAEVLAALREVYDGMWERNVGTDGGRTHRWTGRIALVGAVTTAWDRARDVIAAMGDRFVTIRSDSSTGRVAAARQAIANIGSEETMRAELAQAVGGVIATVDPLQAVTLTPDESERLILLADVVALARTAVDVDYKGDVIDAHAPEAGTRIGKQLAQVFRGAVAIGLERKAAMTLAVRCGRDSLPPLRLSIILDVAAHPYATATDVRRRIDKPRATVDRQLQSLHMLGVLVCDEEVTERGTRWRYSLASEFDPAVLKPSPDLLLPVETEKEEREAQCVSPSHISGDGRPPPTCGYCGIPRDEHGCCPDHACMGAAF